MSTPVIDWACVCTVNAAFISRINTLPVVLKNFAYEKVLILIPRTRQGEQLYGEILMLGYPVNTKFIENNHRLLIGSIIMETADIHITWASGYPKVVFAEPI